MELVIDGFVIMLITTTQEIMDLLLEILIPQVVFILEVVMLIGLIPRMILMLFLRGISSLTCHAERFGLSNTILIIQVTNMELV